MQRFRFRSLLTPAALPRASRLGSKRTREAPQSATKIAILRGAPLGAPPRASRPPSPDAARGSRSSSPAAQDSAFTRAVIRRRKHPQVSWSLPARSTRAASPGQPPVAPQTSRRASPQRMAPSPPGSTCAMAPKTLPRPRASARATAACIRASARRGAEPRLGGSSLRGAAAREPGAHRGALFWAPRRGRAGGFAAAPGRRRALFARGGRGPFSSPEALAPQPISRSRHDVNSRQAMALPKPFPHPGFDPDFRLS